MAKQEPIPHVPSMPPTTTLQQDKVTEAQRGTNLMWETTQKSIALWIVVGGFVINSMVVIVMLYVILVKLTKNIAVTTLEFALLTTALSQVGTSAALVVGFYFSRTNHSATGGIGPKALSIVESSR
jgi:hypothetical protein